MTDTIVANTIDLLAFLLEMFVKIWGGAVLIALIFNQP
jgi:hypothetical protein